MIHRLIVPLTLAVLAFGARSALAQGGFPAPLPGQQQARPIANDPAFPPVNGAAPAASIGAAPASPFPSTGAAPIAGNPSSFAPAPPSQGGGGAQAQACMNGFMPLREDAEKKGKLIKAAGDRHAGPDEACKLIKNYGAAESKMMAYVEKNSAKCGIPAQIGDQLKNGHKNTETMLEKVCGAAAQAQTSAPAGPSLSEVLGSATALPEATKTKKGGSAFDTLTGNVLTR